MRYLLSILFCSFLFSDTLYVPDEYNTIQSAIDACSNGDTILVADGIYYENLIFDPGNNSKTISIISQNGPDNTIIDGMSLATVLILDGSTGEQTLNLNGFTIQNGWTTQSYEGGGIFVQTGNIYITNCKIVNNSSPSGGGGISASQSYIEIMDSIIKNNSSVQGAGVFIFTYSSGFITNSFITNNSGPGIQFGTSDLTISNVNILNNSTGILANGNVFSSSIINSIIRGNEVNLSGSSLFHEYSNIEGSGIGTNIDEDPQFVCVDNEDYNLLSTSPCIGAGSNGTDIGAIQYEPTYEFCDCYNIIDQCGVCGGNNSTCYICDILNEGDLGGCDMMLGYSFNGYECVEISGCGAWGDVFDDFDECNQTCDNCHIIDPNLYGPCEMILGWAWTGEECTQISGCGYGEDEEYFYDSIDECTVRCTDIVVGCTEYDSCNYNPDAIIDDGSCIYTEENYDCDGNCIVEIDECGICNGNGPPPSYDCDGNFTIDFDNFFIPCSDPESTQDYEDCDGNCFNNTDCVNSLYDGCIIGYNTWIDNGLCDDNVSSFGLNLLCDEYGSDCGDCGTNNDPLGICAFTNMDIEDWQIYPHCSDELNEDGLPESLQFIDCSDICFSGYEGIVDLIGDGECYSGNGFDFQCEEWGYECGDCGIDNDPCDICNGNNTCNEEEEEEITGDLNGDGLLNVIDVVTLVTIVLTGSEYSSQADLNGDGSMNVVDIVMMVSLILNG